MLGLLLAGLVAEFDLAESENLTGLEGAFLVGAQLNLVEEGAVGGTQILDDQVIALEPHFTVMTCDGRFREGELVIIDAPKGGLRGREIQGTTGKTFGEDNQLSHSVRAAQ